MASPPDLQTAHTAAGRLWGGLGIHNAAAYDLPIPE